MATAVVPKMSYKGKLNIIELNDQLTYTNITINK